MRAGDVLCEVETDKSTVGFEVQEDFVLAKRLFPEGAGDISVGTSIAIGVRKVEFVEKFKDVTAEGLKKPLPVAEVQEPKGEGSVYPKH